MKTGVAESYHYRAGFWLCKR